MAEANNRMLAGWDGDVGRRWVADRERYELMNAPFGDALMRAADIQPGHVILDVGCGFGARTLDAAVAAQAGECRLTRTTTWAARRRFEGVQKQARNAVKGCQPASARQH